MILLTATAMNAQKYIQLTSSDSQQWMQSGAVRAESAPVFTERVSSDDRNPIVEFGHWEGKGRGVHVKINTRIAKDIGPQMFNNIN